MRASATGSALLAAAICPKMLAVGAAPMNGTLTTYVSVSSSLLDGQCEFAGVPVNSTTDPMLANYLRDGMHCAIGDEAPAFGNGELCGGCYRVRSKSRCGMNGELEVCGTMSEAVVMVSTGGPTGPGRFDCFPEAFEAITGATSGEFSIEFEETECTAIQTTPSVVQYSPSPSPYYCKLMFENIGGWGTLESVEGCLGDSQPGSAGCKEMRRLGGQTWTDCPQGTNNKIRFHLQQVDPTGERSEIECVCRGKEWPWALGDSCACGANFGGITTAPPTTTSSTITTTTGNGGGGKNGGNSGGADAEDGNDGSMVVSSGSASTTIAFAFVTLLAGMHA